MENLLNLSEDGKTILGLFDKGVESIVIPSGVTSIGKWAFYDCSSLESITLPFSVTSIGDEAFSCCRSLKSITLPDSLTSIGDEAFYGCSSLESITLPSGVTSIGESAFSGCSSLKSIDVSGDNAYYTSVDGILFNKDLTTIVSFPQGYELKEYTLPSGVTSIGYRAFGGCSSLENITLPDSVTSIGKSAFRCCSSLQSITIPSGATSIGRGAFSLCKSLQSIHFNWADPGECYIGDISFTDNCTLRIPAGTYESYRQHPVFGKFKNIIENQETL